MLFDFNRLNGGAGSGPIRQSTGFMRFLEIVFDNLARLAVSSLFTVLAAVPGAAALTVSALLQSPLLLLPAGILGGAILGPFYGAMMDGIMLSLRDLPGSWWNRYRHALKRDWKDCIVPGIAIGCLAAVTIEVLLAPQWGQSLPPMMFPCLIIGLLVAAAFLTYLWPQRVTLDLPLPQVLRNCLFLIIAHPAVTLGAVAVQALYWGILVLTVPYSGIFLLITGTWLPALAGCAIVFSGMDTDLKLSERLSDLPPT